MELTGLIRMLLKTHVLESKSGQRIFFYLFQICLFNSLILYKARNPQGEHRKLLPFILSVARSLTTLGHARAEEAGGKDERRETSYYCTSCLIPFHKECFTLYHTQRDLVTSIFKIIWDGSLDILKAFIYCILFYNVFCLFDLLMRLCYITALSCNKSSYELNFISGVHSTAVEMWYYCFVAPHPLHGGFVNRTTIFILHKPFDLEM